MSANVPALRENREPTLIEVIQQAVNTPGFDVGTLERIIALKERMDDQGRRNAFAAAMSRLQAKLPQIDRRGVIKDNQGNVRSRYAKLEDLDVQIKPYIAEEGFAFSFDTAKVPDSADIRVTARLSHCEGHSEEKHFDLPIDDGGAKSKVQQRGSTLSYGRRQLIKMHLNLVEVDLDGTSQPELITAKDAAAIEGLLASTNADVMRFLRYMAVEKLEDIHRRDVPKAMAALRSKAKKDQG